MIRKLIFNGKETGTIQADGPRYLINALVYKTTKSSIYCV